MIQEIKSAIAANKNIMLNGDLGSGKLQYAKQACVELNKKSITVHFSIFDFSSFPGIPSDMDYVISMAKKDNAVVIFDIDDALIDQTKSVFILECMAQFQCIIVRKPNEFVFPRVIANRIHEFFKVPSLRAAL